MAAHYFNIRCHVADFYEEMQAVGTELLTEFNQGVITYTPVTPDATGYGSPVEGAPVVLNATAIGVSQKYLSETITSSDIEVTMAVIDPAPTIDGFITIDGTRREIISVKPIPSAGTPSVYKVFVKG